MEEEGCLVQACRAQRELLPLVCLLPKELVWRREQRAPDDQWEQVEEGGTPDCCWEEPASWCWPVKSEADRRKVWRGQSSQSSLEVRQHCR